MSVKQSGQGLIELTLIVFSVVIVVWAAISLLGPLVTDVMVARAPAAANAMENLVQPNDHAIERHGDKAITAANCFNNGGNIMATRVNPTIGRKMKACLLDDKWFIKIEEENGDLVTMFPKEKFRTLEQILRYMTNSGYTQ